MTAQQADLVAELVRDGHILTESVAGAFRRVPRIEFVPAAYADKAYQNVSVGWAGESCASQPSVVAQMLEQLKLAPGMRVVEVGTATGFNAALMATIVGDSGHVLTLELDKEMADVARENLASVGASNVTVVTGDAAGLAEWSSYDRAIWTCAAWEVPRFVSSLRHQHGRLVIPLMLRGNLQKCIAFDFVDGRMSSDSVRSVQFVVQRGLEDPRARNTRGLHGGWTLWRDHGSKGGDYDPFASPVTCERPAVTSNAWELVLECATWLAVRNERFCSLFPPYPPGSARPLPLPPGVGLPLSTGFGLCHNAGMALVALDRVEAGRMAVVGFGDAEELTAELSEEVALWSRLDDRAVTAAMQVDVVPKDMEIAGTEDRRIITKDHSTLLVEWR